MAAGRPNPYEKYSTQRPRRNGRLSRFLVMMAAVAALAVLIRGQIFAVREIVVTGNSMRSDAEIAGLSGIRLGMNILNVNKEAVERNISADNYVELLEVRTELPDTVILEVRERTASAAVNCAGVIMLTDQNGFILERLTNLPRTNGIIVVSGMNVIIGAQGRTIESGTAGQLEIMSRVLGAICENGVQHLISELNVSDPDNLYLVSQTGIQVLLGDEEKLGDKLVWMQAVLEKLTQNGVMRGVLDVSSGKNATYADR